MRLIFTILCIFSFAFAFGQTHYYVDTTGNDSNVGTSAAFPFKTIAKANSIAISGDAIYLKSGQTWHEKVIVSASNITYGSYGTANKPLITGFVTATGWTNIGGNLWQTTATGAPDSLNTVLIDGIIRAKCRYPNTGYLTFTSRSGDSSITGTLTGTPNYTGAECVVRTAVWVTDVVHISSQSGGTLNFTPQHLTYSTDYGGTGYFIQNSVYALDQIYEWYETDTAKKFIIYSVASPNAQYSTIDTLIWVNNKSNVTFNGIAIEGANKAAFQIDTSSTVLIQNCRINNNGRLGISGLKSPHLSILNDSIQNSLSNGIYFLNPYYKAPSVGACDSAVISGNYLNNTAIFAGMGMNNNGRYIGIDALGLDDSIKNNQIDSSGYNALMFGGKRSYIAYNFINYYDFVKDDGGGIYTGIGSYLPADYSDSSKVLSNIILNGVSAQIGEIAGWGRADGIYADDFCRYITIDGNTVSNTDDGIYLHDNSLLTVTNNKLFKNRYTEVRIKPETNTAQNISFFHNQMYSDSINNLLEVPYNLTISNFQTSDSNYYYHQNYPTTVVYYNTTTYDLPSWVTFSAQDVHSNGAPSSITSDVALLKYNTSSTAQTFSLSGYYTDFKGNFYNNSITLQPFQSAILFKSTITPKYSIRFKRIVQK